MDWFDGSDATISPLIRAKHLTHLSIENHKQTHKKAGTDCQKGIRHTKLR